MLVDVYKNWSQPAPQQGGHQWTLRNVDLLERSARVEIPQKDRIRVVFGKLGNALQRRLITVMVMVAMGVMTVVVAVSEVDVRPAVMLASLIMLRHRVRMGHRLPQQAKRNQQESNDSRHAAVIGSRAKHSPT